MDMAGWMKSVEQRLLDLDVRVRRMGTTEWQNLTLVNGWVAFDGRVPQYRRQHGMVYFRGLMKNAGAVVRPQTFATLAPGFAPEATVPAEHHFLVASADSFGIVRAWNGSGGYLDLTVGSNNWVDLSQIFYKHATT